MANAELIARKKAFAAQQDWFLRFVWLAIFSVYLLWPWIIEQLVVHDIFLLAEILESRLLVIVVGLSAFLWLVSWRGKRRLRRAGLTCPNCSMPLVDGLGMGKGVRSRGWEKGSGADLEN